MKTYVTSDFHFFHKLFVEKKLRPVASVDEMNEQMLDALLSTLKPEDLLYVLGDIYFGGKEKGLAVAKMLQQIPCETRLVIGNHDNLKRWPEELAWNFTQALDAKIIRLHKTNVFMSHYPIQIDKFWKGEVINLHGHTHGISPNPPGRLDVSVDCAWVYFGIPRPFLIEEAMEMALEDLPATHKIILP